MWKIKNLNNVEYIFNIEIQDNEQIYKFYLTDFCKLWHVEMSKDEIIARCKDSNNWLEAEDEILLKETMNLFEMNRNDVDWNYLLPEQQLCLSSTFGGIKFSFRVNFQLTSEEDFFRIVVSPLLLTIQNLRKQNEYLQKLLRKKDIEIAEYKLDGAVISRKNIETPVFQESLLPNLFDEKNENVSLNRSYGLIDDQILSSFNKIYEISRNKISEMKKSEEPPKQIVKENKDEHIKSHELIKVPKLSEPDFVVKSEPSISVIPVPAPIQRKKPQARKLKNL